MAHQKQKKWYRHWILAGVGFLVILFTVLFIFVNLYLEPILRNRIHLLIIQGSDSLYTYHLGKLKANLFGGNVEIEDLQIKVDSAHYYQLHERNALPALTMDLNLRRGYIKGIGLFALMFGRKITVEELMSSEARIRLSRHPHKNQVVLDKVPMWKAIQPKIKSITIHKIQLNGIKLHYTNADTSDAVKFEFNRCDALLKDIQIDSASSVDTSRIAFTKSISLRFNGLKFRTNDSTYKMKARWITYSSTDNYIEIDSFKLQPTLDRAAFYQRTGLQQDLYYVEFDKIRVINARLDHFIRNDVIDPDSILLDKPSVSIYLDKSQDPVYKSKIGKYPQEHLLRAASTVMVHHMLIKQGHLDYTETNPKNGKEGQVELNNLNIAIDNITNDSTAIERHPYCLAKASGSIFGNCPVTANFTFYLDSSNGRFDASGSIRGITAAQVNPLAEALTNMEIRSFDLQQLNFRVRGADYEAAADVRMKYNNLFLIVHKADEGTGKAKTKKFATKLLNRYILWPSNPGPDNRERTASNIKVYRLTTESLFGLLWKTIFAGMQHIMLKS
jgi:hypothetical protein